MTESPMNTACAPELSTTLFAIFLAGVLLVVVLVGLMMIAKSLLE
jgi:hypothetical protein